MGKGQDGVSNDRRHDPSPIRGGVAGSVLAMHRLLLYALAAMNGGPFSSDPVCKRTTFHLFPMLCVAASWPSTHPADRSTAPARGALRWTLTCYYAMSATKSHCPRWHSSGHFHHLQKSRVQFSVDGKMCSEASPVSTSFPY